MKKTVAQELFLWRIIYYEARKQGKTEQFSEWWEDSANFSLLKCCLHMLNNIGSQSNQPSL